MGMSPTLKTIEPLVKKMMLSERLELIRWVADGIISRNKTNQPTEDMPQDEWKSRISAEAQTWYSRPDKDRQPYLGQHVAVLSGQVVDHDSDRVALYQRIQEKYPDTPVLIAAAEARRPHEFLILSPRLERN